MPPVAPTNHKVLSPHAPQLVAAQPREYYVDPMTSARLRRTTLGSCASGSLGLGSIVKSTGVDLFYGHRSGRQPGMESSTRR